MGIWTRKLNFWVRISPKLATILEETQDDLHTEPGESPCAWIRDFSETEREPRNQNFVCLSVQW